MKEERKMQKVDLERRLIDFAVDIIKLSEGIYDSRAGNYLGGQIIRSGTSPALNYGEAQSAESTNDFIHKLKIILKELRETYIYLTIIKLANLYKNAEQLDKILKENNELISIFVKSVITAIKNSKIVNRTS